MLEKITESAVFEALIGGLSGALIGLGILQLFVWVQNPGTSIEYSAYIGVAALVIGISGVAWLITQTVE